MGFLFNPPFSSGFFSASHVTDETRGYPFWPLKLAKSWVFSWIASWFSSSLYGWTYQVVHIIVNIKPWDFPWKWWIFPGSYVPFIGDFPMNMAIFRDPQRLMIKPRLHEGLIQFDGFIVQIRGEPGRWSWDKSWWLDANWTLLLCKKLNGES